MFRAIQENGLWLSINVLGWQSKEMFGVGSRVHSHLGRRYALQFSQLLIYILDVGGFIAFSAMRMRREEGAVGFD